MAPEPDTNQTEAPVPSEPEPEPTPPLPVPATPRTRKAKEQTRLGVGRPVIAGGTGARAITKSISVPKRARVSKSIAQPVQDTIMEEGMFQQFMIYLTVLTLPQNQKCRLPCLLHVS